MNWSSVIWNMYRQEGKTVQEIINYFDQPLVNREYILTVLENIKYLKKPPKIRTWNKRLFQHRPPLPGTKARITWDKVQEIGGKEAFLELEKTKSLSQIARDWNFSVSQILNYKRDFIIGRSEEARFRPKVRYEIMKRYRAGLKRRPVKPKDLKNLW
jgi:hypothetical protein